MNEAFVTALTFPSLPWSVGLAFCVCYWGLAALGLFTDHLADLDAGAHGHGHGHGDGDAHHGESGGAGLAGILARLGLGGVPIMLMLLVLCLCGWVFTYYVHLLALPAASPGWRWALGCLVLPVSFGVALAATSLILRPVRRLFARFRSTVHVPLLGRVGTVISPQVDAHGGRVEVPDGGAGLILQARASPGSVHTRGAQVVLTAHRSEEHCYEVVSVSEFPSL